MSATYPHGSYGWWKANYATDQDYADVCKLLAALGWDTSKTEIDHFPPDSTYSGPYAHVAYAMKPAFPLIVPLHQPKSGESYGGGYATSSKSSNIAKGYRSGLSGSMSGGDFFSAMKQDLADKMNLSLHATSSNKSGTAGTRMLFNNLLRPAVVLAYQNGWITELQGQELLSILYNG